MAEACRETLASLGAADALGVNFSQTELERLADVLAQQGAVAAGADGATAMRHPELVDAFWQQWDAGADTAITLYEVCLDGGLLCHTLARSGGEETLTLVRVVWDGDTPVESYRRQYALTALTYDGAALAYAYDMPDNPPGTNHDGHIDTKDSFRVRN